MGSRFFNHRLDETLMLFKVLYHRNKKLMLWTEGWTRRLDDSLNVLLYYVRGMSPASSMQGIERMRKVGHISGDR